MADVKLSNIANVVGTYDAISTTLTSEAVITDLISGLTILKTADKQNWATGDLTYTVTVTNGAENAFETPTFSDTLDPTTGLLSLELETIATGASSIITFQVQKV